MNALDELVLCGGKNPYSLEFGPAADKLASGITCDTGIKYCAPDRYIDSDGNIKSQPSSNECQVRTVDKNPTRRIVGPELPNRLKGKRCWLESKNDAAAVQSGDKVEKCEFNPGKYTCGCMFADDTAENRKMCCVNGKKEFCPSGYNPDGNIDASCDTIKRDYCASALGKFDKRCACFKPGVTTLGGAFISRKCYDLDCLDEKSIKTRDVALLACSLITCDMQLNINAKGDNTRISNVKFEPNCGNKDNAVGGGAKATVNIVDPTTGTITSTPPATAPPAAPSGTGAGGIGGVPNPRSSGGSPVPGSGGAIPAPASLAKPRYTFEPDADAYDPPADDADDDAAKQKSLANKRKKKIKADADAVAQEDLQRMLAIGGVVVGSTLFLGLFIYILAR
jgi:hypothetical protein